MNPFLLILVAAAIYLIGRMFLSARPAFSAAEADAAIKAGAAVLIDVREPAEWSSGVAGPAALLSFSDLRGARQKWRPFLEKHRGKRMIVYCASGARSGSVAALLRREGHNAVNLGGLSAWANAGLPTRRPS